MVEPDRPQMTVWRMRFSCWMNKARNTHSEYVTLIAFPRQQWLYERTSMLRHKYIACNVILLLLLTSSNSQWPLFSIPVFLRFVGNEEFETESLNQLFQ
jgi:hypothetical protein